MKLSVRMISLRVYIYIFLVYKYIAHRNVGVVA